MTDTGKSEIFQKAEAAADRVLRELGITKELHGDAHGHLWGNGFGLVSSVVDLLNNQELAGRVRLIIEARALDHPSAIVLLTDLKEVMRGENSRKAVLEGAASDKAEYGAALESEKFPTVKEVIDGIITLLASEAANAALGKRTAIEPEGLGRSK